jgi:hypothetical protein
MGSDYMNIYLKTSYNDFVYITYTTTRMEVASSFTDIVDAINSIDKGLAGENYKFSKPFKDIVTLRVTTGKNLKDPKYIKILTERINEPKYRNHNMKGLVREGIITDREYRELSKLGIEAQRKGRPYSDIKAKARREAKEEYKIHNSDSDAADSVMSSKKRSRDDSSDSDEKKKKKKKDKKKKEKRDREEEESPEKPAKKAKKAKSEKKKKKKKKSDSD